MDDDPRSVSSPRRVLSFSRNRRGPLLVDPDDNGENGPKPSEVYGFVGSISTVVATVIFLTWAYVPDSWLHFIGIFYYPDRYWALALPTYGMVIVLLGVAFYIGLNLMITLLPTSLNTIFDDCSREPLSFEPVDEGGDEELPIDPISDIGIDQINNLMFKEF